ncbi:acyl carrier protein [Alteromonas sp. A081]|uniref:acyl carrier protein n=1 Tax=Alteromonas sp. A081 TaxID=3410269 RepID=UPI003B9856DE
MSQSQITQFIVEYIEENTNEAAQSIDATTEFAASGILDSFAILNLVITLESEFEIKFSIDELSDESIRTVGPLARLVYAKRGDS